MKIANAKCTTIANSISGKPPNRLFEPNRATVVLEPSGDIPDVEIKIGYDFPDLFDRHQICFGVEIDQRTLGDFRNCQCVKIYRAFVANILFKQRSREN